jgi:hypothetical protein
MQAKQIEEVYAGFLELQRKNNMLLAVANAVADEFGKYDKTNWTATFSLDDEIMPNNVGDVTMFDSRIDQIINLMPLPKKKTYSVFAKSASGQYRQVILVGCTMSIKDSNAKCEFLIKGT